MRKSPRTVIKWILSIVLVVGIFGVAFNEYNSRMGESDYSEAALLANAMVEPEPPETEPAPETETEPPETEPETETEAETETEPPETEPETEPVETYPEDKQAEELAKLNLDALQVFNEDVFGWIRIPGTELNYPLVQGEDNDYYLRKTWKGNYSIMGCIFLDYRNGQDFSDFNTIIYGHRMLNNTMFGELKNFKEKKYQEEHPFVYLKDEDTIYKYEIFAAYEAKVSEILYKPGLTEEEEKQQLLDTAEKLTVWDTGIEPDTDDRILTLVTCTGMGFHSRWILQAVQVEVRPVE